MFSFLERLFIGDPLKNDQLSHQKFTVFWGLPILSSDAISSVAYAGEEILYVLIFVIGMASYKYMFYASMCIVFLLFILVFSYRQTIDSYPNGGGSYIVAKDNLGTVPGLTAGAALSIDYILTAAVSICSGTAAITSAIPQLYPYRVLISLGILLFLTLGNLRGLRDSSRLFGVPTYLFIISMAAMIIYGIIRTAIFGYVPKPLYPIPDVTGSITAFLFLRAFASGCTALTGVEAVSNGIPNFAEPSQKNAKKVLILLGCVVLFIFGGISYLATLYHAVPRSDVTVVSQIAKQVFGGGSLMYYIIQVTTAFILIMAANTAFADLPLLLSLMGNDGFAPRQFAKRGKRLSFSNGIILLFIAASLLIIIFKSETHLLLPMYAIGVFISFTLSQTGMFTKWVRGKQRGWRHKAIINGIGALVTFTVVIILVITKIVYMPFPHGAWIVVILIPFLVFVMLRIKTHYAKVAEQLRITKEFRLSNITAVNSNQQIIILVDTLNKAFIKAYNYSKQVSTNIVAFHASTDEEATEKLKQKWKEYNIGIPLIVKDAPYRDMLHPLVDFIKSEERCLKHGQDVTVVLTQFVPTKWWHYILHNQTGFFIKTSLYRDRHVAVITIPYVILENSENQIPFK